MKYLDSDRLPRMKKLWWYGYGKSFTRQMEAFIDLQFAERWSQRMQGALRSAGVFMERKR